MHAAVKLLTGLSATVVLTAGASIVNGRGISLKLGTAAGAAMAAHGVRDGSVSFRQPDGRYGRVALLSGTADAATRAAVIARLKRHPGILDARWVAR
jgi:hypothetical protein